MISLEASTFHSKALTATKRYARAMILMGLKGDWDISYCGLNCAQCPIYKASHGDDELQKSLVTWMRENNDSSIDYVGCEGCRYSPDECWSTSCTLRECAIEREYKYCFDCSDFVCEKLKAFANEGIEHHKTTVENMKRIRKIGLDAWLSSHDEAKFCP